MYPAERKFVDVTQNVDANTTGGIQLLNGVVPGTAATQRIGRMIHLKALELYVLSKVTLTTGVDQFFRLLAVFDKQTNGAALAITDVLESVGTVSHRNLSYIDRFDILYDSTFHLNASAEPDSQKVTRVNIPLRGKITRYNTGTAGTVADITHGSLYFIVIGSEEPGVSDGNAAVVSRVIFTDE